MRTIIILFCTIAVLCASCSSNEDEAITDLSALSRSNVTYSGDVEGVSVLIFGFKNNDYYYQGKLNSGWVGNRISTNLELGNYKFLYYKAEGSGVDILPDTPGSSTKPEDIRFKAKADATPGRTNYVLPVEEIWLPETAAMANDIYTITGNDLIQNTLKRAVSQIELQLFRGELIGEEHKPIPYINEDNIMNYISEIRLDISGVGEILNYAGTTGNKNTYYTANQPTSVNDEGFAYFEGPFVLPTENAGEKVTVAIQLIPKAGTILEGLDLKTTVNGELERNKKLSIKLWLTATYNVIYVDVDTTEINTESDGDKGIWE